MQDTGSTGPEIFATGGAAFARFTAGTTEILSDGTHSDVLSGNASSRFGFAVGGGVEYAFTDYLTLKAEYLFYDLGT